MPKPKHKEEETTLPLSDEELVAEIATLNALMGEWSRMQHDLINKATAAQLRLQSLYKRLAQRQNRAGL